MYQLRKEILPIVLPSMVEAKNILDHPRTGVFGPSFSVKAFAKMNVQLRGRC